MEPSTQAPTPEPFTNQNCPEHSESLIAFCVEDTCKKAICISCMPSHIGHKLLNHTSFAEYIHSHINSNIQPVIQEQIAECDKRIENIENLPKTVSAELTGLHEMLGNLSKIILAQRDKFKESIDLLQQKCAQESENALKIKTHIDSQSEQYTKALIELEKYKTQKNFNGVYEIWNQIKKVGDIEKLKIDQDTEQQISTISKKIRKLQDLLSNLASGTIKKFNLCPNVNEIELAPEPEVPVLPMLNQTPKKMSARSNKTIEEKSQENYPKCSSCGLNKPTKSILECGCFACIDCIQESTILQFIEYFPEPFVQPLIECKQCKLQSRIASIKLSTCSCLCEVKSLKSRPLFPWNNDRKAFEWPSCPMNPDHKLLFDDILTIWGSAGYAHFESDLTIDQSLKAISLKKEITYAIIRKTLSIEQIQLLCATFKSSDHLKHIVLGPKTVHGSEFKKIYEGIKLLNSLETLIIKQNSVGQKENAMPFLASVLTKLDKLKTLDLSGNLITADSAKILFSAIGGLQIKTLNLANNEISMLGAKFFADTIKGLPSLEKLYLDNNKLGMKGAKYISLCLENINLLSIGGNAIGAQGAKYICESLEKYNKIETLYLQLNDLATEGAKAVADLLERCTSLRILFLQQNRIGTDAGKRIGEALEKAESIEIINLSDNFLEIEGAKALLKSCENTKTLKIIDLSAPKLQGKELEENKMKLMEIKGILLKI